MRELQECSLPYDCAIDFDPKCLGYPYIEIHQLTRLLFLKRENIIQKVFFGEYINIFHNYFHVNLFCIKRKFKAQFHTCQYLHNISRLTMPEFYITAGIISLAWGLPCHKWRAPTQKKKVPVRGYCSRGNILIWKRIRRAKRSCICARAQSLFLGCLPGVDA